MSIGKFLKNLVFEENSEVIVNEPPKVESEVVVPIELTTNVSQNITKTLSSCITTETSPKFSEELCNIILTDLSKWEGSNNYMMFKKMFMDENNIKILPNTKERGVFILNTLKLSRGDIDKDSVLKSIDDSISYVLNEQLQYGKFYDDKIIDLSKMTEQIEEKVSRIEELAKEIELLSKQKSELEEIYSKELSVLQEQQSVGNSSYEEIIRIIEEDKKTIETEL